MSRSTVVTPMRAATGAAAACLLATSLAVGTSAQAGSTSRTATHHHHPAPSHFTHGRVDNPWFPLKPGTKWSYRGMEDGDRTRDVMIATYRTRVIDGVVCRVVFDRVWTNGRLGERTHDYYAQTKRGTVWYFGERTAELDRHGHVTSREGSFMSGVDGAEAGVFMTRHPQPGPAFFQEYYPSHAMDRFTVLRRGAHVSVPLIRSDHALLTRETSPLEPGIVDHKYYVRDLGDVSELTVKGGQEKLHLVGITHIPHR
jgi:hypothetical protein